MATLLGIISIEQDQSFFAERYFREIITIASQTIAGNDCYVRIMPPLPAHADPATTHAYLIGQGIEAALVIAPDQALLEQLSQTFRALPSIISSAPRLGIPWSYVNSDNYGALRKVVTHLADQGRKGIRLLQPQLPCGDYLECARGYNDAISALGLTPASAELTYPIDDAVIDQQVLVGAPDALIAPDDQDALAPLSRLQRRGLRVPADIALVGFDDEDFAADTFPTPTTVSQPLSEMARRAALYLLARLGGVERDLYQHVLPCRLVMRESSSARPTART
ncbi:MAG: substrate-binding domain-containing protein [Chloroflexota bacterium]|nr:substrate-binding domain-containing protein [Chloroflexota bacterium]